MKPKFFNLLSILIGLLTATTGCATTFPRMEFDRFANPSVQKIAILRVPEPLEYTVQNTSAANYAFGLVGAAVSGGIQQSRTDEFTQATTKQGIAVGSRITEAIEAELKQRGYEVTLVTSTRLALAATDARPSLDYSHVSTDADAILDVRLESAGYISVSGSPDYVPYIQVTARLGSMKGKSLLYFQTILYGLEGPLNSTDGIDYLTGPGNYSYDSFDKLMAHSQDAQFALTEGASSIARSIAAGLGRARIVATPPGKAPAAVAPPSAAPAAVALPGSSNP